MIAYPNAYGYHRLTMQTKNNVKVNAKKGGCVAPPGIEEDADGIVSKPPLFSVEGPSHHSKPPEASLKVYLLHHIREKPLCCNSLLAAPSSNTSSL